MKVKMNVSLVGSRMVLAPGDEWDFPPTEAKRLIAAGYAVEVKKESTVARKRKAAKTEKAVLAEVSETAVI